jgi:hypothetical protein
VATNDVINICISCIVQQQVGMKNAASASNHLLYEAKETFCKLHALSQQLSGASVLCCWGQYWLCSSCRRAQLLTDWLSALPGISRLQPMYTAPEPPRPTALHTSRGPAWIQLKYLST